MSKINLEKGSFLPELKSVTSVKSVQMGAIFSRDWSPLHSDQKWAKEKGNLPDIILNNYTINGWISKYLTDLLGPDSRLGSIQFNMKKPICPNQTMVFKGKITKKEPIDSYRSWLYIEVNINVSDEIATSSAVKIAINESDEERYSPWRLSSEKWCP
tara:strand:- start:16665 stop:17135 length:471 start_codon:yes stop_codon:yes gene_type:complete